MNNIELSAHQAEKLHHARKSDKQIRLAKLTPKQARILATCLIYFMKLHERAMERVTRVAQIPNPFSILDGEADTHSPQQYIEPIPLRKLYNLFNCNGKDRIAVTVAANAYFERITRGNFKTGKCSGWKPRQDPRFNSLVKQMLAELFKKNEDYINAVTAHVTTKGDEVAVTTTFKFDSKQQAEDFIALIAQVAFYEEE
jgi:hypothetical protein